MDFNPSTAESLTLIASAGVAGVGTPQLIGSGASSTVPLIDVRQFNSYYLQFNVRTNLATTGYNQLQVDLAWQSDANTIAPTTVFADQLRVWADSAAAPVVALGRVYAQDTMHGSFMQITFTNNGADTLSLTYQLMGTTRILPGPYVRQGAFANGVMNSEQNNIPVSGELVLPLPALYGMAELIVTNKGTHPMDVNLDYNLPGDDTVIKGLAAGALVVQDFVLPKAAPLLVIIGTAGDTVSTRMITLFGKV